MVNPVIRHAMLGNPHDFMQLQFRNYRGNPSEIIKLYESGLSLADIELKTGISKSIVRRTLLKHNISLRNSSNQKHTSNYFLNAKSRMKPPYGFWYIDGKVVRHPKEYLILLQVIKMWKKGQSLNSIATQLNDKKVPSPMGKKWSWNSIANIIQRIKAKKIVQKGEDYELR